MAMPATRRYSFDLANDPLRHVLASSTAIVFSVGVAAIVTSLRPPVDDRRAILFGIGWLTMFTFTFLYALAYALLSTVAFRGLSGSRLRARLRNGNRPTSRHRFFTALAGGRSTSVAVQFAIVVLVGVLAVALTKQFRADPVVAAAAVLGVIGSWTLMTTTFASHYALAWARDDEIDLPDSRDELRYSDFGYASVQLSTAFAIADARLRTAGLRRTATLHAVVAFGFSTVIVALLVSLVANAAG